MPFGEDPANEELDSWFLEACSALSFSPSSKILHEDLRIVLLSLFGALSDIGCETACTRILLPG